MYTNNPETQWLLKQRCLVLFYHLFDLCLLEMRSRVAEAGPVLSLSPKMTLISGFFSAVVLGLHISAIIPSSNSLILPLKLYSEQDWGSLPCLCLLGVGVTDWSLLESSTLRVGRSGSLETLCTGGFLCLPCIPVCYSCFYCFCSFAFYKNYEVAIRLTVDFADCFLSSEIGVWVYVMFLS